MLRPFPPDATTPGRSQPLSTWRLRLLLAALLLFASEILLWTDPLSRSAADWILLSVGYVVLAALLLDLAARFRARNIFGVLALAGIYGLLNSLLLNPDTTLTDVPRTLFTRVLGAHTFVGLLMLVLFLRLVTPRQTALLAGVLTGGVVGFGWGTWARWSPTLLRVDAADTSLPAMLVTAAVLLIVIMALLRVQPSSPPVRLLPLEWVGVLLVLLSLLIARAFDDQIDSLSLVLIATLLVFSLALLWFLKRGKGQTVLDGVDTVSPPWRLLVALAVSFFLLAAVGYGLPRGEGAQDPVFLITVLLTGFGVAWLPGVSLAVGGQAVARQVRAGKL